jgi:hypothetical protein
MTFFLDFTNSRVVIIIEMLKKVKISDYEVLNTIGVGMHIAKKGRLRE